MEFTRLGDTYLVRLQSGEEIISSVGAFANDRRIDAATVTAIGSARAVVVGFFDRKSREFLKRSIDDDMEIASLTGNVAVRDGRPSAHLHAVFSGPDGQTVGGHLFQATTGATCELVIQALGGYVQRVKDEDTGLYLLDL